MARGRGRGGAALCCALALAALGVAGCGAEEHANEPRPPVPTRVSVSITPRSVEVEPGLIGIGDEPTDVIAQNAKAPEPDADTDKPLVVTFVGANLTDTDSRIELRGPKAVTSGMLVANGNNTFQAALPTGVYTVAAADIPTAKPARLRVGPDRPSSENEVLTP